MPRASAQSAAKGSGRVHVVSGPPGNGAENAWVKVLKERVIAVNQPADRDIRVGIEGVSQIGVRRIGRWFPPHWIPSGSPGEFPGTGVTDHYTIILTIHANVNAPDWRIKKRFEGANPAGTTNRTQEDKTSSRSKNIRNLLKGCLQDGKGTTSWRDVKCTPSAWDKFLVAPPMEHDGNGISATEYIERLEIPI
jgi:hypothetical protein